MIAWGYHIEPAPPGNDRVKSPHRYIYMFRYLYDFHMAGTKSGVHPGRYSSRSCGNPIPTGRTLIGWSPSVQPALPWEDQVAYARFGNTSINLQFRQLGGYYLYPAGGRRLESRGNPNPTDQSLISLCSNFGLSATKGGRYTIRSETTPYIDIATTRGKKRCCLGSKLPRSV